MNMNIFPNLKKGKWTKINLNEIDGYLTKDDKDIKNVINPEVIIEIE